jgi:cytochrome P450
VASSRIGPDRTAWSHPSANPRQREDAPALRAVAVRPERFIGQAPPGYGWFPFGGGIRRCVGASFATFEMQVVLPEVLRAVTLRPATPRPARVRRESVTFVPHDGARCVVTARHAEAAGGSSVRSSAAENR